MGMGNKTLYDLKISIDKLAYKCQVLTGIGHHPSEIALRSESYVKYLSAQFDGDKFKQAINNAVVTRPNIIEDIVTWGMPILSFLEDFKWVKYTKKSFRKKTGHL